MANLTPKSFYIGTSSTGSNVYTTANTVGNYSIIKNINLCNTTSSNAVCSIHILVGAASPAANNKILSTVNVLSNNKLASKKGNSWVKCSLSNLKPRGVV